MIILISIFILVCLRGIETDNVVTLSSARSVCTVVVALEVCAVMSCYRNGSWPDSHLFYHTTPAIDLSWGAIHNKTPGQVDYFWREFYFKVYHSYSTLFCPY